MYLATVTQKGQITIPNELRKRFGVKSLSKVKLEAFGDFIKLSSTEDLMSLAGSIKTVKGKSVLKARAEMEKKFDRI